MSASSPSALDPFDPTWPSRPVRAGIAVVDALLLIGTLLGAVLFGRAKRLPWAHWRGVPGKVRLLLGALAAFAIFQTASDIALLSYRDEEEEAAAEAGGAASYSPALGAYVILGIAAVAAYAAVAILFTFMALHSQRGWRWGLGIGTGFFFFFLATIAVAYPGLARSRGGFLAAWLPYLLGPALWFASFAYAGASSGHKRFFSFVRPSAAPRTSWGGETALLNDVVADSTEDDSLPAPILIDALDALDGNGGSARNEGPASPALTPERSLDEEVRLRLQWPCGLYLGMGLLFLVLGLAVKEDDGRAAVGVLLALVFRCLWPVHLWAAAIGLERAFGAEWVEARGGQGRRGEEMLFESIVDDRDEAAVAKTLRELLQGSAGEILINHADLSLGAPIARGGSGVVRKGLLYNGVMVACKSMYSQIMMGDLEEAIAEAKVLAKVHHPNVLSLYGLCLTPTNTLYLVLEWCPTTLEDYVLQGTFGVREFAAYGQALLDAMAYLHAMDIVHRDLKPSNLLLDVKGTLKIADMGLAMRASYYDDGGAAAAAAQAGRGGVSAAEIAGVGTPQYAAPETAFRHARPQRRPRGDSGLSHSNGSSNGSGGGGGGSTASAPTQLQQQQVDPTKLDVYAAALVLWFLYFRRHPLVEYAGQKHELMAKVLEGVRPPLDGPPQHSAAATATIANPPMPLALRELLAAMWHADPRRRPSMQEAADRFRALQPELLAGLAAGPKAPQEGGAMGITTATAPTVGAAAYDKAALSPPAEGGDYEAFGQASPPREPGSAAAPVGAAAAGGASGSEGWPQQLPPGAASSPFSGL